MSHAHTPSVCRRHSECLAKTLRVSRARHSECARQGLRVHTPSVRPRVRVARAKSDSVERHRRGVAVAAATEYYARPAPLRARSRAARSPADAPAERFATSSVRFCKPARGRPPRSMRRSKVRGVFILPPTRPPTPCARGLLSSCGAHRRRPKHPALLNPAAAAARREPTEGAEQRVVLSHAWEACRGRLTVLRHNRRHSP